MSLVVFVGVHLVGDPVHILISDDMTQEEIDRFIQRLGLDRPAARAVLHFLGNAARGDLGNSFVHGEPRSSSSSIACRRRSSSLSPRSSSPSCSASPRHVRGLKPEAPASRAIMAGSILGFSLPTFWVGLMLIMVFAVMLGWLPSTGRGDFMTWGSAAPRASGFQSRAIQDGARHAPRAPARARRRSRTVERARRPSSLRVACACARTSSSRAVLVPRAGGLIAFSVVTETVFAWPGMGKLLIDSIQRLDRPVVVAYLIITVLMFVVINWSLTSSFAARSARASVEARPGAVAETLPLPKPETPTRASRASSSPIRWPPPRSRC